MFLILAMLILIVSPLIINWYSKLNAEKKQVNLFISPRCEEFFGKETTETLLEAFMEQNPDLKIRIMNASERSLEAGGEPDIYIFDEGDYNALVSKGLLTELSNFTNFKHHDRPEEESAETQLYAIPLVSFMDMLFYNIEILTNAGFDRPPKTREEFLACARAVSNFNKAHSVNTASFAISLNPEDRRALSRDIFSWIWAAGSDFWSEENGPSLNSRIIISDISFFGSLYSEDLLAPGIFDTTGKQQLEEFANGKTAMIIASSREIPYLREKMKDEMFGITTIPNTGSSGKNGINLSGIHAGINTNCKHPDEALVFLEFLAEQRPLLCEILKAVPGMVSDIIKGDYLKSDPFYTKAQDIFESSVIVQGFSGKPGAEEYETAFIEDLRVFLENNRTPLETVNAIQQRWDKISGNEKP